MGNFIKQSRVETDKHQLILIVGGKVEEELGALMFRSMTEKRKRLSLECDQTEDLLLIKT